MQYFSEKTVRIARFVACSCGMLVASVVLAALLFSFGMTETSAQDCEKMTVLSLTQETNDLLSASPDRDIQFTIQVDGKKYPIFTNSDTVAGALKENGLVLNAADHLSGADADAKPENGMEITLVRVTKQKVVDTQVLWAQTRYVLDKSLQVGEYVTRTVGKNGSVVKTYEVVYENGVEISKTLVSTVRTEAVDQVIAYNEQYSFSNSRGDQIIYSSAIEGIATAYIPDGKWGYTTYTGNRARVGVIAVDPSVIPLGTKVYVKTNGSSFGDYGYAIAWDTGSAIKGNKIDLFMESYDLSMQWGIKDVTIYILEDQSVDIFALRQGDEVFIR